MASYIATVTFPDGHTLYTWFSSVSFNVHRILVAATPAERAWMATGDQEPDRFEAHHRHQIGMGTGERDQTIRDRLGIGPLQSLGDAVAAGYPDEVEDVVVTVPCDVTWKSKANRRLLVLVGALEPPKYCDAEWEMRQHDTAAVAPLDGSSAKGSMAMLRNVVRFFWPSQPNNK